MLQKNQEFIFQEIEKYFNYCEIESLDEQEENDISPMTEISFNNFKKKTEKLTTKDYLNNYYGRKYLQIFDFQNRNKVAEK
ncbi:hypothetical protein C2G38_2053488 [Gigaspora rosea]|uniref:Uncharacterized protein n=1 Tax=Gigaspora rosea TaxID=44941 RepID=A0A397W933_9GLOM|nr:hypothetical protein C2G38_2053488 [Gigaspora rosea]